MNSLKYIWVFRIHGDQALQRQVLKLLVVQGGRSRAETSLVGARSRWK